MIKHNVFRTFTIASLIGIPMVLAAVPRSSDIANDTAIYQSLHEIKVSHVNAVNFDSDLNRLSATEKSYRKPVHQQLPLHISTPMKRIINTPYRKSEQK